MKKFYKILIPVFLFFIFSDNGSAQTKFEREYRINSAEVPKEAKSFVDSCNFMGKIKWYAEESQDGKTFEAKTRHLGKKYSIEFDTTGVLQDIEKEVEFDKLDKSLQVPMGKTLGNHFKSYKVRKIQIQWTGERDVLLKLIKNGHSDKPYTTQYEIIVKARKNGISRYYEVLLDASCDLLKILEIKQQSADNLVF